MKMYEMNQVGYASLPNMTSEELNNARKTIKQFLQLNPSSYYLMLNNEAHYYTVYTFIDGYKFDDMSKEIIEIAAELGDVKSIELAEDKQKVEFWINYAGECRVFYLFDYARGVVEV